MSVIVLWIAIVSAIVLAALILLFHIETSRGERLVLRKVRAYCDAWFVNLDERTQKLSWLGHGSFRATLHYFLHRVLSGALSLVSVVSDTLRAWQRSNKQAARSLSPNASARHLTELQLHKQATALTPAQKRKRAL